MNLDELVALVDESRCTPECLFARDPDSSCTCRCRGEHHGWARFPELELEVPVFGSAASTMPDMCHDYCAPALTDDGIYYPYRWHEGKAHYRCAAGHHWTCGWGHQRSGTAPENWGKAAIPATPATSTEELWA